MDGKKYKIISTRRSEGKIKQCLKWKPNMNQSVHWCQKTGVKLFTTSK